jgi:stage II sporulation protein D
VEAVTKVRRRNGWLAWGIVCLVLAGCAPRKVVRVELPDLEKRGSKPLYLRINIVEGISQVTISCKDKCRVSMGKKATTAPAGKEWCIKLVDGTKVIETRGSQLRMIKDPEFPVIFTQKVKDGFVIVNGLPYRGQINVKRVARDRLMVVNEVPIEEYLRSVVPSEIGDGNASTVEAVKAQAVAARTYAVANLGKREALGYDLAASTSDQVYSGVIRESPLTDRAVRETEGIIAMYDGKPINAVYHSTCGGHTCSNEDSWTGKPIPYLRARPDFVTSFFDQNSAFCSKSPMFTWTRSWTAGEFVQMMDTNLRTIVGQSLKGSVRSARVTKRDRHGRAVLVEVTTTETTYKVERGRIRNLFSDPKRGWVMLPSTNFELKFDGATYVMNGRGWGHGVGMCQWGAIGMAKSGYSYEEILKHYYKGIYLARVY